MACNFPSASAIPQEALAEGETPLPPTAAAEVISADPSLSGSRPRYAPGELVDYLAQAGDTLPVLALRFNTSVPEIRAANPFIPASATTMPPGMPMKIPIYYAPLWGSPYQIIPDSHFVNGPVQIGFNTVEFVDSHAGWLKNTVDFVGGRNLRGGQIVDYVARNYSVSPRLLLALLEYQAGALSQPQVAPEVLEYPLGHRTWEYKDIYMQLVWAANFLNNGFYAWRTGDMLEITLRDGRLERFDPWQNAATVSLHHYFNFLLDVEAYESAISPEGLAKVYAELFGDPWLSDQPHIPGTLTQPEFILPFEPGNVWAYTAGPHSGWGTGAPLAALDFAPPSKFSGCIKSDIWATAVASGVIVRSETGQVMLDLDGDGDERTGWNIFYLHVGSEGRVSLETVVQRGEKIGHPSCEGGRSTGTHIHIARKYNGEWIPAQGYGDGILAFNMENWIARNGIRPYLGTLIRNNQIVTASTSSNAATFIKTDRQ